MYSVILVSAIALAAISETAKTVILIKSSHDNK